MLKQVMIGFFTALALAGLSVPAYAGGECAGGVKKSEGMAAMSSAVEGTKSQLAVPAVNVGNMICPVSKEKIGSGGMKPATYEYQGKVYNFCCEGCIADFKKNPEQYIKKVEEELKGAASQSPRSQ